MRGTCKVLETNGCYATKIMSNIGATILNIILTMLLAIFSRIGVVFGEGNLQCINSVYPAIFSAPESPLSAKVRRDFPPLFRFPLTQVVDVGVRAQPSLSATNMFVKRLGFVVKGERRATLLSLYPKHGIDAVGVNGDGVPTLLQKGKPVNDG